MGHCVKVRGFESYVQMVETRMPFRYGTAKLTRCPHLYLVATIEDSAGNTARGIAADNLPPKWFDKAPDKPFAQELAEMQQVIGWATEAALAEPSAPAFRLWLAIYHATQQQAAAAGLPPLLGGFGPSLVERAVNDALGNLLHLPFHELLASNAVGIEFDLADTSLRDIGLPAILPPQPRATVAARHTVGLSDPIYTADIPENERLHDGLPQSLEEVIDFYGIRYFKIKVSNALDADIERLTAIAALLEAKLPQTAYHCTLDGNEQYPVLEQLLPLLEALKTRGELRRLAESIVFIEQPLARAVALDAALCRDIHRVTDLYPLIIDESDGALESFNQALHLGYSGTSHKNCKNTFKSIINKARACREQQFSGHRPILSAEDLTNIGVVALNQDLVALSTLGICHVERNGHHYFRGLGHLSPEVQRHARCRYPDLYVAAGEETRLQISDGTISCRSLHQTLGLGSSVWPELEKLTPVAEFDFAAL